MTRPSRLRERIRDRLADARRSRGRYAAGTWGAILTVSVGMLIRVAVIAWASSSSVSARRLTQADASTSLPLTTFPHSAKLLKMRWRSFRRWLSPPSQRMTNP